MTDRPAGGLMWINNSVDWEALADIFMARHIEKLSSKSDFDEMRRDLAEFLGKRLNDHIQPPGPFRD